MVVLFRKGKIMQYNNEYENFEEEKKESFFKKHSFFFGVLTSMVCLAIVCFGIKTVLKQTGQLLIIGESGASTIKGSAILDDEVAQKIDEIYQYMNIYYYGEFDKQDIYNSLYSGVLESLEDPYSVYYTKEEYEDMQVSTSGKYVGIGAGVSQNLNTMEVTITKVYRGTPSEDAGLKNGDMILSVEGIQATSVEVSELVQHIRGTEGTTVHMVIFRPSTGETLEFDVERRKVVLPSIEGELLEDGIGYIQITEFQEETDEQFSIGAMVTLRDIEMHKGLNSYSNHAIANSVKDIVGVQFRNMATVGGSIWGRFGFSDVLTIFLAMDCYVELYKGGTIPLEQFAAMKPDNDILVRLIVKKTPCKVVYTSMRNQRTDFPVITSAVSKVKSEYRAVLGARPARAVIIRDNQDILKYGITEESSASFAQYVANNTPTEGNLRGSAAYRTHLIDVLVKRSLAELGGMQDGN